MDTGTQRQPGNLGDLRALINKVGPSFERSRGVLASGWPSLDAYLGRAGGSPGLARGVLHEWLGVEGPESSGGLARAERRAAWQPALLLLTYLAARAFDERRAQGRSQLVLWIGRRVWPYAPTLVHRLHTSERSAPWRATDPGLASLEVELAHAAWGTSAQAGEGQELLQHSLFIDPPTAEVRLWALDVALRSNAVCAVVADGRRLPIAATRRLQLAAREGDALVLVARAAHEVRELSCASTRFVVRRAACEQQHAGLRWSIELLRAKGLAFASELVS